MKPASLNDKIGILSLGLKVVLCASKNKTPGLQY